MKEKRLTKGQIRLLLLILLPIICIFVNFLIQKFWAHRNGYFSPDYERVVLTETTDYETIFRQTGLGKPAVDKLLEKDGFQRVLDAQESMFTPTEVECEPLLGWFTREDRQTKEPAQEFVNLEPGDILITLSTHSLGWRHGHGAIYIGGGRTLECAVLGKLSDFSSLDKWRSYSNFAVLRIKDVTEEEQKEMVNYAVTNLKDIPYHLSSGFIGPKDADIEAPYFGLHCTYLTWYAWNHFGYDTDSDGGRLATAYDLLHSEEFEIVQIYGMDPREFVEK